MCNPYSQVTFSVDLLVACACDVGGTASGQTCDKATGVCHCRPHVIGKFCNRYSAYSYSYS